MITKIRIEEEHPSVVGSSTWPIQSIDLEINNKAGLNGYTLIDSSGLGPPEFKPVVVGFDSNGVPVLDSVPSKRIITFKIGLTPGRGQTVSDLRRDLYKYISRSINVCFFSGSKPIMKTHGFVKYIDPEHFSNKPMVSFIVECSHGYLESSEYTSIPLEVLDSTSPVISYSDGDAQTGFFIKFRSNSVTTVESFTISNYNKLWYEGESVDNQFVVTYDILEDDEITIDTENKRILLYRSPTTYDITGYLNSGPVWPKLHNGVNTFTWDILDTWATILEAKYLPKFWGV